MSGHYREDFLPALSLCGIHGCVNKPFSPLDVIAKLEEVLAEQDRLKGI
jgi:hypothetical protein